MVSVVTPDLYTLLPASHRDDRDVVMLGGEQAGRWHSMICLGFEDSSELTQSPQSPHWPNWVPSGNGEILWIKNRSEFNFVLLSLPPSGTSYG